MVEGIFDDALNDGEVGYHTVLVQFLGTAIHLDFPVMTVQRLAFALVTEHQIMRSRNLNRFFYVIHIFYRYFLECFYLLFIVLCLVFYPCFLQSFAAFTARAAFAAMVLAPAIATPRLAVIHSHRFPLARYVRFTQ